MPNEPQGYVIGFEELYRAVTRLEQKIDARFSENATTLATHHLRIESLEKATNRRWQTVSLWVTCVVALVAAVLPNLIK